MSSNYRKLLPNAILILVLTILLVLETVSFAWLSTAWNSGEFAVTADYTNTPRLEIWTYHKTASNASNPAGWYLTYADDSTLSGPSIPQNKVIENIRTESNGATTFTKSGDYSLYFGTINNLVQTEDNLPVYMKLTVSLPEVSTNTITISYSLPSNYVKAYYLDPATTKFSSTIQNATDNTAFQTMVAELQDKTKYQFIRLQCNKGATTTDYSVSTDTHKLPDNFDDIFAPTASSLFELDSNNASSSITFTNNKEKEQNIYLYFKFSVPTKALQDALLNTDLKSFMPIYLVFDISLDFYMTSSAQN